MTHNTVSSHLDQERKQLWLRGCVLVGVAGLIAVGMLSANLYGVHQRPLLNAASERINPNTASIASLVRLPGIGRARALDIVHYRDNQHTEKVVFSSPQDLENIKGIGPKTAGKLSPWLVFEGSEPRMDTNEH